MRLFEYQGKELFKRHGIQVPRSILAKTSGEAVAALDTLKPPVAIKAQVLAGGRGKAGGVAMAKTKEETKREAERILSLRISGERPRALLIEEASEHKQEMYLSITLDRSRRAFVAIASQAGGIEVESLGGKVVEPVPLDGLSRSTAGEMARKLKLSEPTSSEFVQMVGRLDEVSRQEECELAEINPLAIKADGRLIALDSKVILDDNALFRHPEFAKLEAEDPLEGEAAKEGFAFVRLEGDLAVVGNGAGLVLSTLDLVKDEGGAAACFLDLGGGAQKERVEAALRLVNKLPNARKILINIFGGITRTTDVAAGLKQVISEGKMQPIYARISGAEEESARAMLSGTPAKMYPTALEAVKAAVTGE